MHPAIVRAGCNSIHFVKGIITVFLVPKISGKRIEREAKSIAHAVRVNLFDVRSRLTREISLRIEEGIISRG